ncbi:efflux RND transporter periplasmic adaptor subunit [bacterium]|nr:efflux RND transporter periplasmic adaptor subunit [bacterium]
MSNDKQKLIPDNSDSTVLPRRSWKQRLLALGLCVTLLLVGFVISRHLIKTRPQAKRKAPKKMEALVEVIKVMPSNENVLIEAQGRVIAAREITLQARVFGQVIYLPPDFIPGGIIKQGEILLKLDDTDYQLELRRKEDALALAVADLRIEEGSQTVALKEWELITSLSDDIDTSSRDLALREPHLAKAKAHITSAQTALEKARVDLERTVIRAPFNLVVRAESVDLGSQVSIATNIATLAATDIFWAEISLPMSKLAWFEMPELGASARSGSRGAKVLLSCRKQPPLNGQIISLTPDLDKDGLMARLLVAVADPLGLKNGQPPLLLGSFVKAEIVGRKLNNVYSIPRSALRENDLVLIADSDDRLSLKSVTVAYHGIDTVLINSGLISGERLVTSSLATPISGMPLKIAGANALPQSRKNRFAQEVNVKPDMEKNSVSEPGSK